MRTRPKTSTSARSGGGKTATPAYDSMMLEQGFINYVDRVGTSKAFDFGLYWTIPTAYAVRGRDVLRCQPMLDVILAAAPAGLVWYSDLRRILMNLAMDRGALIRSVPSNHKVDTVIKFADLVAERIMTFVQSCSSLGDQRHQKGTVPEVVDR